MLIQIPAQTKHRVTNRSGSPARIVFFDSARDVVTFDEPLMPMDASVLGCGLRRGSRRSDTHF